MARDEYDPFERAMSVLTQVNRWMGSVFEGQRGLGMPSEGQWHPPTDVYENEEGVVVCMEVAGVEPSSIEVSFAQGQLTASGHRAVACATGRCHLVEIENGRFSRSVIIPIDVDDGNIRATYRQGLLEIVLPRRKEASPRRISISDESEEMQSGRKEKGF